MDLWILGCGPSLGKVEIPRDVFSIGINDSYLKHWSPVYCTSDKEALRRDYWERSRALCHITAIDPLRVDVEPQPGRPIVYIARPERPMLRKSGVLAYWTACQMFKPDRIHMVGFDMESDIGHFKGSSPREATVDTFNYYAQRERLLKLHRKFGIKTWIWLLDRFTPLETVPFDKSTLNEELRSSGIMRYAYQRGQ